MQNFSHNKVGAGGPDLAELEVVKRNRTAKKEPHDRDYTESAGQCHHD